VISGRLRHCILLLYSQFSHVRSMSMFFRWRHQGLCYWLYVNRNACTCWFILHFVLLQIAEHCSFNISLLSRLFWVDLIKWVSNVHKYVRTYVHPYTESFFSISLPFGMYVQVDEWCMTVCNMSDPTQCQCHEPLKVGNPSIFKSYLLHHLLWDLATNHRFLN